MNLALFDFDGTITTRPTYTDFIRLVVRRPRVIVGGALLLPALVSYRAGLLSQHGVRLAISRAAFWRQDAARIDALGEQFAAETLSGLIRPIARERIDWHKAQGDHIVVVSAGLDVYLAPWCRALGLDSISTQLERRHGRLTGRYVDGDCCGGEKARRIRARYALDRYASVFAYGDTEEDRDMLEIADRRFFCWEEVREVPVTGRRARHTPVK